MTTLFGSPVPKMASLYTPRLHSFLVHFLLGAILGAMQLAWAGTLPYVYTVMGPDQGATLRAITSDANCPAVVFDGAAPVELKVRSLPAPLADRSTEIPKSDAQTDMPVLVCETTWPVSAQSAQVNGQLLQAPKTAYERILILGDTGCRLKASELAYQDCSNPNAWPFPGLIRSAKQFQPDLVVHLGDLHYRESPCPLSLGGCAGSPWGYGWLAWQADFFSPAQPLFNVPWVFVRGNHESCARAGQGWMRFIDPHPLDERSNCDRPENDIWADFTSPYSVWISPQTQFLIFDSSRTSNKLLSPDDTMMLRYLSQLELVQKQARTRPLNFFLSHHPHQAVLLDSKGRLQQKGNPVLRSALQKTFGPSALPLGTLLSMHGHVHVFEGLVAPDQKSATLIMGNSGSMTEGLPPPDGSALGALGAAFAATSLVSQPGYGFAMLYRESHPSSEAWSLVEYDVNAQPLHRCLLGPSTVHCVKVKTP